MPVTPYAKNIMPTIIKTIMFSVDMAIGKIANAIDVIPRNTPITRRVIVMKFFLSFFIIYAYSQTRVTTIKSNTVP